MDGRDTSKKRQCQVLRVETALSRFGARLQYSLSRALFLHQSFRTSTSPQTPPWEAYALFKHPPAMANVLGTVYRFAIPLAIGFSLAQASVYDVKGGSRAVIFDRLSGVKDDVVNEGTHFLIPWLQKSIIYDVRTKPRNISTTTGSKDLQMVSLTLRVLHRPEVKMLPKIYQVFKAAYLLHRPFQDFSSSRLAVSSNPTEGLAQPLLYSLHSSSPTSSIRITNTSTSPSASTTTSASCPPSATKSSKPSSHNSTPPN